MKRWTLVVVSWVVLWFGSAVGACPLAGSAVAISPVAVAPLGMAVVSVPSTVVSTAVVAGSAVGCGEPVSLGVAGSFGAVAAAAPLVLGGVAGYAVNPMGLGAATVTSTGVTAVVPPVIVQRTGLRQRLRSRSVSRVTVRTVVR